MINWFRYRVVHRLFCLMVGFGSDTVWFSMLDPVGGEEWDECAFCGAKKNMKKVDPYV